MRERILQATAEMLVIGGTDASMASIARHAGIAAGSLYNHFESKDELIRAVCEHVIRALADAVVRPWDDGEDNRARLVRYIDDYIDFIWADGNRAMLFEYVTNLPLIPPDQLHLAFADSERYITRILKGLQRDGALQPCDTAIVAAFMGGAIRNTLKWRRLTGRALSEQDRDHIRRICQSAALD